VTDHKYTVTAVKSRLNSIKEAERYLFRPDSLPVWNYIILAATIFTALVTPYEVALLPVSNSVDILMIINRVVDFIFVLEILLSFNTMYVNGEGGLVRRHAAIAKHYLRGWFLVDVITTIPYDVLNSVMTNPRTNVKFIRFVRIFRLIKLFRLLRASKKLGQSGIYLDLPSSAQVVVYLALIIILLNHWLACVWAMTAFLQPADTITW
jgi:hypothetical protein